MTAQTKSRIMLSVLIGAAMAPSVYYIIAGHPFYGALLLLGGAAALLWLWKPWKR
jgi:hypothetical protein